MANKLTIMQTVEGMLKLTAEGKPSTLIGIGPMSSNLLQATAAAAWINGRAGELAQEKSSDISMTAGDTARALPEVFRLLRDQR